ncbi:hypothetical protein IJG28_01315 [Candidatus Saccharibacteria bacterium]|nr:hypothetical protein [Candidatus Saccharibacteria bacterium]
MIKIFTGDDRTKAQQEITKLLGSDYEIIEGSDLLVSDLPSLMQGASLFATSRNILIRDLSPNKPVFEKLPEYLDTPHNIIIEELSLDRRSTVYKILKDQIEIREFTLQKSKNFNLVFNIYSTALVNGPKSLQMLDQIEADEDPIRFCGLLISQALKAYRNHPGAKEKRALKELSQLDLRLKTTSYQPWLLIRSFLLRLSSL